MVPLTADPTLYPSPAIPPQRPLRGANSPETDSQDGPRRAETAQEGPRRPMTFSPTAHDGPRRRTLPPHPPPHAIAIFWLTQRCFGAPAARPMSWVPQSQVPKLGLDVGDVLSVKNVRNAEGAWLECMPRATKGLINDVVTYTSCLHSGLLSHLRGETCWLSMSPGAYAFLVLFIGHYGSNAVHVISRTNKGSWYSEHRGMTIERYV